MKGKCVNYLLTSLLVMMMPLMGSCGVKRSPEARKHYILCTTNLKFLACGMLIWAEEHEGELPEALEWEEKVNQYIDEDKAFSCPSCKKHYIYLGNGQKRILIKNYLKSSCLYVKEIIWVRRMSLSLTDISIFWIPKR